MRVIDSQGWQFEAGLKPSSRSISSKKIIYEAVSHPRPSPWKDWIVEVIISDFVRITFKFFPFLNVQKHIISKVLVRSLNSYQSAESVQSAELMVQKDIKQPTTL